MSERADGEPPNLRYDSAPARRVRILDAVHETGFISVTALTQLLGVSDMTVRRDLRKLAQQGRVRVVHGGVSSLHGSMHSPAFGRRVILNSAAKRHIGVVAAARVSDTATVAIDAGTTTYAVAQALSAAFRGTVVTHSVPVMQLLLHRAVGRVVGLGGELLPESQAFVGPRTVEATAGLRVDQLFLGAAAADELGIYVATDLERPTKLAMMSIAREVVLLADATKFRASSPVLLCDWASISAVITDAPPPPRIARLLSHLDVDLAVHELTSALG